MNPKIIIAIDGHSSTGKSTAAKQLAKKLGYIYVDTGAMYRAVSYFALRKNIIENESIDVHKLNSLLNHIKITFKRNQKTNNDDVYLNNENVEKEIRTLKVSSIVSKIAEISEVRSKLVSQQQVMGRDKGVVMDGRDIGTVVFPNAELKVFMTASPQVRARRRYVELSQRGDEVTLEEVLNNVLKRDHIDSTRKDSPLTQASDAKLLDTSEMTREQQLELLLNWAMEAIS